MIIPSQSNLAIDLAKKELFAGRVIAIPTDTVYGLACLAENFEAVEKLYRIKGRSTKKPIAVFVKNIAAAEEFLEFNAKAKKIAKKFLPGKLTMVLRAKTNWQDKLARNLNQEFCNNETQKKFLKNLPELGFRIVKTDFLNRFFANFDGILAVTSANKTGNQTPNSAQEIAKIFPEILVIDSGEVFDNRPSTVIRITEEKTEILRHGEINLENFSAII
jgi:tRNA threonylcarbamoyl adenosine modification protein (Sua5/YciO/YrdC/YwlC family)